MIVFYSKSCEGCKGNQALSKVEALCKKNDVEFEERRTILWKVYEKEANDISEALGVKLPFFYNTDTEQAIEGNTFTEIEKLEKLVKGNKNDG